MTKRNVLLALALVACAAFVSCTKIEAGYVGLKVSLLGDDKGAVVEVTLWDNRPRYMWVWDNANRSDMEKAFVFFRMPEYVNAVFPVYARTEDGTGYNRFKHCADILQEPDKLTRRLTYRELALWLNAKPDREWKYKDSSTIRSYISYEEYEENEQVNEALIVREGDSPWFVPLATEA